MKKLKIILFSLLSLIILRSDTCTTQEAQTAGGIKKVESVSVDVDINGNTQEQNNIKRLRSEDNKIGSVKYLYIISPYTGDVIIFSTVIGKETSSSKRLNPSEADGDTNGFVFDVNGRNHYTRKMMNDDGTYGSSESYIYWWDSKNVEHRHYLTSGQIIHVASQPMTLSKTPIIDLTK